MTDAPAIAALLDEAAQLATAANERLAEGPRYRRAERDIQCRSALV